MRGLKCKLSTRSAFLILAWFIFSLGQNNSLADTPTNVVTPGHPNFSAFLDQLPLDQLQEVGPEHINDIPTGRAYFMNRNDWDGFMRAAVNDKLTNLRAFALLGERITQKKVALFNRGSYFEESVKALNIDLGLALPAYGMAYVIWTPGNPSKASDHVAHLKVYYWKAFEHEFQDEILPATLKIGIGRNVPFTLDGRDYQGKLVETDLYYGHEEFGFKDIKGLGGRKHGMLGFFQRILFFLPDAVDDLVINQQGTMITRALINTEIKDFERQTKYQIHYNLN